MASDVTPAGGMMDAARLAEIRERAAKATPGPWAWAGGDWPVSGGMLARRPELRSAMQLVNPERGIWIVTDDTVTVTPLTPPRHEHDETEPYRDQRFVFTRDDGAFIAHARSDVPDLLAALDAERATAARLRATLRCREVASIPGGMACRLCLRHWKYDAPERHAEACVLREETTP